MATLTKVDHDPFSALEAALTAEGVTDKQLANIARAVHKQESSSGRNTKTSNRGAVGGMQIIPATFDRVADPGWDIHEPLQNARAGVRYLRQLHKQAGGDPKLTAAGYYGGEGAIDKARHGIAVSDPKNPNAPNTLQYAAQVASNVPKSGPKLVKVDHDPFKAPVANAKKNHVDQIPGMLPQPKSVPESSPGFLDRMRGPGEGALSLVSGIVAQPVANIVGVGRSVVRGDFGTTNGANEAERYANRLADAVTYQPRSKSGQKIVQSAGNALNSSGLAGVPIPELNALAATVRPTLTAAGASGGNALANLVPNKSPVPMRGMGAANTSDAMLRLQRAQNLPVPIKPMMGQLTRTFEQQRFEKETAKLSEGEPIRQRVAETNENILKNFDSFIFDTGAEYPGNLRAVGQIVNNAVVNKAKAAKIKIKAAYDLARDAGDMAQPVNFQPLSKYLAEHNAEATTGNVSMLAAVRQKLSELDPRGTGYISINDMEEVRKMAGRLSPPGTPNEAFIGEVKSLIDSATDNQGGPLYRSARRLYTNYANEFKNTSVIDKMIRTKPGTKDRAVAFEDVFHHSIMGGSLDDVRAVRRTLQTGGAQGKQAWKELQGQTVQTIKDTISKNSARDINGNPVVSPAKIDAVVKNLDADGKLDFIFGKQGAQQIRDVRDLALDTTAPPGVVNSSIDASVLIGLLDTVLSGFSGMPLPIGSSLRYGIKKIRSNALSKKVNAAINPNLLNQ